MTLYLRKDGEHSQLSLLWILLHEFRHKIQAAVSSVSTNLDNDNFKYFMDYLKNKGNDENNINHVLHEILPYEIDANIFACELLNIGYPGSKFQINDHTISLLK
jgi:DNA integrity scanning protein DisA with diadenylate cyclase activity